MGIKINGAYEDTRLSDQAILFIEKTLKKDFRHMPDESVVNLRVFVSTSQRSKAAEEFYREYKTPSLIYNGYVWYKTLRRVLDTPKKIKITSAVNSVGHRKMPVTYRKQWRVGPGRYAPITFNTVDEVHITIIGHEAGHALMRYTDDPDNPMNNKWYEAQADVHGRKWLAQWREFQKMEHTLEQAKQFLTNGDYVEYHGTTCKVASQFKHRSAGQMVHLIDSKGNQYRNIPFGDTFLTDDTFVAQPKERLQAAKESPKAITKPGPKKAGVIASIVDAVKSGPITKLQIHDALKEIFPERDPDKMRVTINGRLSILKKEYGENFIVSGDGDIRTYHIR